MPKLSILLNIIESCISLLGLPWQNTTDGVALITDIFSQRVSFLWGLFPWLADGHPLCATTYGHPLGQFSSYEETSHVGLGPTRMISFNLITPSTALSPHRVTGHILRCWGLRFQHMTLAGGGDWKDEPTLLGERTQPLTLRKKYFSFKKAERSSNLSQDFPETLG